MNSSEEITPVQNRRLQESNFGSLADFMDRSDVPCFVRDNDSKFLYINPPGLFFLNLPSNFKIHGKGDEDIPAGWASFTEQFKKQDRIAECSGKSSSIISIQLYNFKKEPEPFFCPKTPLYSGNECVGTVGYANKLMFISTPDFIDKKKPFVLSSQPPNDLFTKKELNVIFWMLQRLSSKEVAKRLNLSHRTVENTLQTIYQKANVHSFIKFIEYCKYSGFESYVPPEFIREEVNFVR
jgi:DNA-binding CsgD family transcriptional regulator